MTTSRAPLSELSGWSAPASGEHLELRLLPYWQGVKYYRTSTLRELMTPQEYQPYILASAQYPTVADGRIVGFHTRADMYFSRLPTYITRKLWRNFCDPLPTANIGV